MSSLGDMIGALFGGSAPQPVNHPADPVMQYPSHEDAAFARQQDYSYGQPYAPYFTGDKATLLTGNPNQKPMQTTDIGKRGVQALGANDDYYARAALATNNSALAGLGFDPSHTAADYNMDPKMVNILGEYRRKDDQIYANALDPSAIVHESIHRGIEKLRNSPQWQPEFNDIANGPMNEAAVRHIMTNQMGNPEVTNSGPLGKQQRDWAEAMFNGYPHYQKLLNSMEAGASQYMANKHPMGPR